MESTSYFYALDRRFDKTLEGKVFVDSLYCEEEDDFWIYIKSISIWIDDIKLRLNV